MRTGKARGLIEADWVSAIFSNLEEILGVDAALLDYLKQEAKVPEKAKIGSALLRLVRTLAAAIFITVN